MSDRAISKSLVVKGVILMMFAGVILSTGGPIIRQIDNASGFQIVFWRSVSQSIFVLLFLLCREGRLTGKSIVAIGPSGLIASVFLGLAFFGFVFSEKLRYMDARPPRLEYFFSPSGSPLWYVIAPLSLVWRPR